MSKGRDISHRRSIRFPLDPLVEVMDRLLGPGGCPWDREQDHRSLRPYVVEEAYEVVGAIDSGEPAKLKEELGDLLLQVVFHAALAARHGQFDMNDVVDAITTKLVRRHPHVFGDARASTPDAVLRQWEDIKKAEAAEAARAQAAVGLLPEEGAGAAAGHPRPKAHLPALMRAQKLLERAARLGLPRPATAAGPDGGEADVPASGPGADESAFGRSLLAVLEEARRRGVDAELALSQACAELAAKLDQVGASPAIPKDQDPAHGPSRN